MRILFLTHYFPPEVNAPASRTFEHCRAWVRHGHEVAVLTNVPNHPKGDLYPGYRNHWLRRETVAGIQVFRMLTYLVANRGIVRRSLSYFFYLVMTLLVMPRLPKADVVVSTSPQFFCGLAGYLVARARRIPWVLEIRDLWPDSIAAVGAVRRSLPLRALMWLVNFAYRKADRIVCVTDSFRDAIVAEGIPADKIVVIKNGVDLDFFEPGRGAVAYDGAAWLDRLRGRFVVSYVGTHGMAHGLDTVLEAAELLRNSPEVVFLLVGDGAERERLVRQREIMRLSNLVMAPQQPKDQMPAIWDVTSVSVVVLKDQPLFETVIPSKIFESMAMGKPVILGVRGESQAMVEKSGAGICIQPESAFQLARAVRRLLANPAEREAMGQAGRRFVAGHFDRRVLAKRYEELLLGLVQRPLGASSPAGGSPD